MSKACHCPQHYPNWDSQDISLDFHPTLSLGIPTFFHMPLAYEAYLQRQHQQVQQLELEEVWPGFVLTTTGLLRGKIIRLIKKAETPSRHVGHFPSSFQAHAVLHHGDVGTMHKPVRAMQMALVDRGRIPKELYLAYLTCPQCEKQRGGAKIMLLRHWIESPTLKKRLERRTLN